MDICGTPYSSTPPPSYIVLCPALSEIPSNFAQNQMGIPGLIRGSAVDAALATQPTSFFQFFLFPNQRIHTHSDFGKSYNFPIKISTVLNTQKQLETTFISSSTLESYGD